MLLLEFLGILVLALPFHMEGLLISIEGVILFLLRPVLWIFNLKWRFRGIYIP